MLDIVLVLLAVAVLLLLVSLLQPLAERFALPSTLLLATLGMVIGLIVFVWGELPHFGITEDMVGGLTQIGLSADAFLFLFLPPLLFTAGLGVDLRLLKDDIVAVLLLAVVAVVVCAAIVGLLLAPFTDVGLVACLLLGAVVASTDPAAVIGVFRDIGAPRRLTTLVSGESLFNDAAAIVLFSIFLGLATAGGELSAGDALTAFATSFLGGFALGYLGGRLACLLFDYLHDATTAATSVSVAIAYLAFILGEAYLGVSGVVAVVTAALVVGTEGPTRLTPAAWEALRKAWDQLEFWANSLVFVLASMLAVRLLPEAHWKHVALLGALVAAALLARALVLYLLLPLLSRLKLTPSVSGPFKAVILWGGLRGAVTLVLALSISGNLALSPEVRLFVAILGTGYVLFTLFVQATSLQWLLRLLGLDRLPPLERMLRDRVMALSHDAVRRQVEETAALYGFPQSLAEGALPPAVQEEEEPVGDLPLDVGLLTLVAYERELYLRHFHQQTLSRRLVAQLSTGVDRLQDAVREEGLAGYDRATQRILRFSRAQRRAIWLQRRLGWSRPLAEALADRFEMLLITQLVVRELAQYAEGALRQVVGDDLAAELEIALHSRLQQLNAALVAVETRYPAYTEALRQRYLARVALRLEDRRYREHLEQALISREVYADLQRDLKLRWDRVDARPPLDLGLSLSSLIGRVPLIRDLPPERQGTIAAQLRPDLAMPGERIIRRGARGHRMYFLVSGEVTVLTEDGRRVQLGPGSFFGEMALLSNARRNADVSAEGFCHLLVLEGRDFRRVLRADGTLKRKIESVAAERREGGPTT